MKRITALFMVFLVIAVPALCFGTDGTTFLRKDPILAAALSWYIPGLGQLYSDDVLSGVIFYVVENALLIGALVPFVELKLDVTGNMGIGVDLKSKDTIFESNDQRVALALGVSLVIIHIINVIDAVNSARDYNKSYEDALRTNLQYDVETDSVIMGVQGRF
jgi:TM2 domain-containing membrane protein YozV